MSERFDEEKLARAVMSPEERELFESMEKELKEFEELEEEFHETLSGTLNFLQKQKRECLFACLACSSTLSF